MISWFVRKNQLFLVASENRNFSAESLFSSVNASAGSKLGSGTWSGAETCQCESPIGGSLSTCSKRWVSYFLKSLIRNSSSLLHISGITTVTAWHAELSVRPWYTLVANTQWQHLNLCTDKFSKEGWSGAGWPVDEEEVDWYTRQCHTDSHQRIDSITVEGNHYQEHTAYAVDDWEKQRQLQENQEGGGIKLVTITFRNQY